MNLKGVHKAIGLGSVATTASGLGLTAIEHVSGRKILKGKGPVLAAKRSGTIVGAGLLAGGLAYHLKYKHEDDYKHLKKKAYATGAAVGGLVGVLSGAKKRKGESNKTRLKRMAVRGLTGASIGGGLEAAAVGTKRHMEARKYKTRAQNLSKQNKAMIESQKIQLDNLQDRLDAISLDKKAYIAPAGTIAGMGIGYLSAKQKKDESEKSFRRRRMKRVGAGAVLGGSLDLASEAHQFRGERRRIREADARAKKG